jgi:hypothetical protein
MAALSEWLQIMLGEIARKREDLERARDEERARQAEANAGSDNDKAESDDARI